MRNRNHAGKEFDYTSAKGETNTYARIEVIPEMSMQEAMTNDLLVVAARLLEAVRRAPDGDREAERGYIACSREPSVTRGLFKGSDSAADGSTGAGYDFLIKCLRTGAVHGLRMVFVDEGPQIVPLLEDPYPPRRNTEEPAPTTYRSLSRRQVGILQMIARGMPNKCIARSLGIAPETVKTHAKGILSKLEVRTRAQAVARAAAIGLL
jgi:DNA-binding CsgD family transcriptional regulator